MKFIIPTQELNFLINKILNVVPPKAAMPILSNMLIEVSKGYLTLTVTDLLMGMRCRTEVKVLEEGSTTLPARRLAQLCRELTSPYLEVYTNPNEITEISANTSKFKIHGMRSADFPSLPAVEGATRFTVPQKVLKDLLFKVSFAISKEDSRQALTGALMRIGRGVITFLGTDGKRLARAHASVDLDPSFSGSYIVPLKAIEEVLKVLTEEGDATVYLLSDKIAIETENVSLITKLLTGEYPDVSRVIPEKTDIVVDLHREELISLLRQVSLFTADTHHSVKFSFSEGNLSLTANTKEIGEGKVNMPVNYGGSPLDIAFNPGFFLDLLRHSKKETVSLGLTDPYNPGVITEKETDKEEETLQPAAATPLFVIMPMRLSEG